VSASSTTLSFSLLLLFLLLGVAWMGFICYLIGICSGWRKLAKRFSSDAEPYGTTQCAGPLFYSVQMRYRTNYSNAVRLTAADEALYLSVSLLFRVGHPALRIPWSEIQFGRAKLLWRRFVVLTLGAEERIPLRISERMARKLGIFERIPL
jgi:hypothetical protein